jgi:hypothetical protein
MERQPGWWPVAIFESVASGVDRSKKCQNESLKVRFSQGSILAKAVRGSLKTPSQISICPTRVEIALGDTGRRHACAFRRTKLVKPSRFVQSVRLNRRFEPIFRERRNYVLPTPKNAAVTASGN